MEEKVRRKGQRKLFAFAILNYSCFDFPNI